MANRAVSSSCMVKWGDAHGLVGDVPRLSPPSRQSFMGCPALEKQSPRQRKQVG